MCFVKGNLHKPSVSSSPIRADAGEGSLWVVPSWAAAPEQPGAISITMEPGIAFGTGEHPTTRLCLGWLWQRRAQLQVEG